MAIIISGSNTRGCNTKKDFNINEAFSNVILGGVINIPSGNYTISSPLVLGAHDVTINGNGATISITNDFSGPIIDYTGVRRSLTNRLNIVTTKRSLAGFIMGRTPRGDSSGHTFKNCHIQGNFDLAAIYSFASEGCVYEQCNFVTHSTSPCYVSTSIDYSGVVDSSGESRSNTLGWFYNCSFRNYSGLEDVPLMKFANTTSGFSIRDSYAYTGNNGIFIDIDGASQGLLLEATRIEGEGRNSLLLRNSSKAFLLHAEIRKINYTIPSLNMIESSHHILESNLDLIHGSSAVKYVHMRNSGKLWRTRISGNKQDWLNLDSGCQIRMCHLTWVNGEPMIDVYDNVVNWTG